MTAETVLAAMIDVLERRGWSQRPCPVDRSLDLAGAWREVTGFPLTCDRPASEMGLESYTAPTFDEALRALVVSIGRDGHDEASLADPAARARTVAAFNDLPGQTWSVVRRTLHDARDLVDHQHLRPLPEVRAAPAERRAPAVSRRTGRRTDP